MIIARQPTALTVHQQSRLLEVAFDDGPRFRIRFELMHVCSPSAEVQGQGPGRTAADGQASGRLEFSKGLRPLARAYDVARAIAGG